MKNERKEREAASGEDEMKRERSISPVGRVSVKRNSVFRFTALVLLFNFLTVQNVYPQSEFQLHTKTGEYQSVKPVLLLSDFVGEDTKIKASPLQTGERVDFENFWDDKPLSLPTSKVEQSEDAEIAIRGTGKAGASPPESVTDRNDYARYSLDQALDLLRPEYASAVILEKPLSKEDLDSLRSYSIKKGIEIAILVLHGETVLLTTGSGDEIAASPAVREILKKAAFVAHTHPDEHSKKGPTGPDLETAGDSVHYVLTEDLAYAYDRTGILEKGDLDWFTTRYLEALKQAETFRDEKQARDDLNRLIAEQDRLNELSEEEKETWLAGGTISYDTSGLTVSNVTTLPGSPYPYLMTGSSSATTLALDSDGRFRLNYNVTQTGSYSGFTLSFDNAGTSTIEARDLSSYTNLIFGLQGPAQAVKLDFVDINGNKDTFVLTGLSSSTERFWKVPLASLLSTVNKTKIKQLDLYVDPSTAPIQTGSVQIRIKGVKSTPATPTVTSSVPYATQQSTLTLSGKKDADTAIVINGVEVIARNSSTTWSTTVNLPVEGGNTFKIQSKNVLGKLSSTKSVTVKKDTVVPAGSININSGATYATSQTVTLNLSASDSNSGVGKMSFSTDNIIWTSPVSYSNSKSFTLPSGDGSKTVYVKYYDKAGNISVVYSKSIILDTVAPAGSVNINSGVPYTTSTTVTLNLSATDATSGIDKMSFSTDNVAWASPVAYAPTTSFTLSSGDGNKTVYVRYYDKAGKVSAVYSKSITLDTAPPTGTITINNDATYTNTSSVTLNLTGTDAPSGLDQMRFSTDGGTTWTDWEAFALTKSLTLTAGDGTREVKYQLRDLAGLTSTFTDTITLDTLSPVMTGVTGPVPPLTNDPEISFSWSATDVTSGIDLFRWRLMNPDGTFSAWLEVASGPLSLNNEIAAEGSYQFEIEAKDRAGLWSEKAVSSFIIDRTAPSVTLTSPTVTNQAAYTLSYTVTDNHDGEQILTEQITLIQGPNSISRTFTDQAGNSQTVSWTISFLPVTSTLPAAYQASFVPLQWVTTTTLTGITQDDDSRSFTLPFSFRYFGTGYTQIQVSSNGFVQFGACNGCSDFTPDTIPNSSSPNAIAALLWRDLNPSLGGRITYLTSPTQFVVSWEDVPNYGTSTPQRFQLILESNGSLTFQYVTVTSGPTTSIGLENSTGTQGIRYTLLPSNGIAVKFVFLGIPTGTMFLDVVDGDYTRSGTQVFQGGNEHEVTFLSDLKDPNDNPNFSWQWSLILDGNETVVSSGTGTVQDLMIDFRTKAAGIYEVVLTGNDGVTPPVTLRKTLEVLPGTWLSHNVPPLNSNYATLFLDFNGSYVSQWGSYSNITTPRYDQDGIKTSFGDSEQLSMAEIWQRVIEKFIIFGVWVTALDPFIPTKVYSTLNEEWNDRNAFYDQNRVLAAMIGGIGSWAGGISGGVAYLDAFTNSIPNAVYIFEDNLVNGDPKFTAEVIAHESGHGFGLEHQSTYDAFGNKTDEYNPGTSAKAPIMGNSRSAARGLWWYGTSSACSTCYQDDIAVIARSQNGFGFRPDDHGGDNTSASQLGINGNSVSATGIIGSTLDQDRFKFTTTIGGQASFTANVARYGAMLDLALLLYDSNGNIVASADTTSLQESILNLNLTAGTYFLVVKSHGSYGDVGQYTITGTVPSGTVSNASASPSGPETFSTFSGTVPIFSPFANKIERLPSSAPLVWNALAKRNSFGDFGDKDKGQRQKRNSRVRPLTART